MSEFDPQQFFNELNAAQPAIDPMAQPQAEQAPMETEGFNPQDFLQELDQEHYGTTEQMVKTGLEGAARGLAGPLAPMAEKALGVDEEDIKARERVNPITHGIGEAVGLGAGLLTGTGEAGVMLKAGELATQAAGLAEAGSYAARVGSAIVRGAAETAIMQGADETSKMVLHDPESSAQSAIANIGLAGVLGGATGAFITGAVSPLWGATVGPHLENFLEGTSKYLNGESKAVLGKETADAVNVMNNVSEYKPVDAKSFADTIQSVVKNKDPMFKANITPYSAEEYGAFKTFLSPDGKSGYAIKPDGELISVFSTVKGRGESLVDDAVLNKGANKLDAFDINGKLPKLYGKYMDETQRLKFADEFAPTDWDYKSLGRPDVVMMGLNPEKVAANAAKAFDIPIELKAAMSGDPKLVQMFNELREAQHPSVMNSMARLESDVDGVVAKRLGINPEEVVNYSEASGGKHAMDSFVKEYKAKYQPIADEFDSLTEPFKNSLVIPRNISELSDKVVSLAQEKGYLGADIPQDKLVQSILQRLPGINTVQDLAKLNTIVDNIAGQDLVLRNAGRELKGLILNAQQDALGEAIQASGAVKNAPELFQRYVNARKSYAELSKVSQQVGDELGLGRFAGPKTLLTKLTEKRSPEQFLRRLSPKGNAEIINFLGTHFPETLNSIKDNELKQFLKPSVLRAKEGQTFSLKTLNKAIEQGLAGQPERLKLVLPDESIQVIQSAQKILDAIPRIKSSGTAGWQQQMMKFVPQSALGLTALLATHNPFMGVLGAVGGHVMKLTSRDAPDAIKMSMLKFLASDQPIKAGGFKAMVDYLSHVVKGEAMINKATTNILKSGGMVLASSQMPSQKDNDKLNKIVEKYQKEPMTLMKMTQGQTGHYMPDHQTAAVQTMTQSLEYLSKLKPQPFKPSPLDKEIKPTPAQEARYNSALTIANQPLSVLDKAKDGTINSNDMQDIKAMYPAFYSKLVTKVTDSIANSQANDEPIPYKTRMGLSTFLGQPLDTTMRATSIIAAQPKPSAQPQQQMSKPKRGTATLGKSNKQYMTNSQAAEADRTRK